MIPAHPSRPRRAARCAGWLHRLWPTLGLGGCRQTYGAHVPCKRPRGCRRNGRCSRTRHSHPRASSLDTLRGDPSDAALCDLTRTDTNWQVGHHRSTVVHLGQGTGYPLRWGHLRLLHSQNRAGTSATLFCQLGQRDFVTLEVFCQVHVFYIPKYGTTRNLNHSDYSRFFSNVPRCGMKET